MISLLNFFHSPLDNWIAEDNSQSDLGQSSLAWTQHLRHSVRETKVARTLLQIKRMSVKSHIGKVDQAKFFTTDLDNVAKVDGSKKNTLVMQGAEKGGQVHPVDVFGGG